MGSVRLASLSVRVEFVRRRGSFILLYMEPHKRAYVRNISVSILMVYSDHQMRSEHPLAGLPCWFASIGYYTSK